MSLKKARMARRSLSLRIASIAFASSMGITATSSTVSAQERFLKIAFPGNVQDAPLPSATQAAERDINLRERAASTASELTQDVARDSALRDNTNLPDTSASDKKEDEGKKEPITLPSLVVPNTAPKRASDASMPDDMVSGRLPPPIGLPFGTDRNGGWALESKNWVAPVYCHQPTYFHDSMLEEHGHERFPCVQPLVSGARFYTQMAFLPYLSYLNPPLVETPSAGHFRPGTAAPCIRQRAPYDPGALRFQLLTTGTTVLAAQP
jgi:hypothetical protein